MGSHLYPLVSWLDYGTYLRYVTVRQPVALAFIIRRLMSQEQRVGRYEPSDRNPVINCLESGDGSGPPTISRRAPSLPFALEGRVNQLEYIYMVYNTITTTNTCNGKLAKRFST